jgi:hypothetical protein
MKKVTLTQRRWLISLHLLFVVALLGHVIDMILLLLRTSSANSADALLSIYNNVSFLGEAVGPISAVGTVITGVLLCICTNWGLFKHPWIIVKLILTPVVIVIGAVGINKWTSQAIEIISNIGLKALETPDFITISQKLVIALSIQLILLVFMVIISVFKPWGKKKGAKTSENTRG